MIDLRDDPGARVDAMARLLGRTFPDLPTARIRELVLEHGGGSHGTPVQEYVRLVVQLRAVTPAGPLSLEPVPADQ